MNQLTDHLKIKNNIIMAGSKKELLKRVMSGDDVVLRIELDDFSENLFMHNMLVYRENCVGFTYPHFAHGIFEPFERIYKDSLSSSLYIYDINSSNVVVHNVRSTNTTSTVVHQSNPKYNRYCWNYSGSFKTLKDNRIETIKNLGSNFKIRLTFEDNIILLIKPDIIYFTNNDTEFIVKSSQLLLPTGFVSDMRKYINANDEFTSDEEFGTSYISVMSSGKVIIYHVSDSIADNIINRHVRKNTFDYSFNSKELLREYAANIEILVPGDSYE